MAVEIVYRGVKKIKGWSGICSDCKTEVFFLTEDAKSVQSNQRDGDFATLDCPVCTYTIWAYPHVREIE